MKRGRREIGRKSPLGALEFAAALNGDDPGTVLVALKRFTKTIRRERRRTLSTTTGADYDEEEGDDDSTENGEDENFLIDQKSKKLKEDWMEDTKDYNVPFIGTSVAKGDTGTVQRGVWPSGLLEAYLKTSPLAAELTNNESLIPPTGRIHKVLLRSKQYKASNAVYTAYLEALAELFTAAMPFSMLQQDLGAGDTNGLPSPISEESKYSGLASNFLRSNLVDLLLIIGKESSRASKGESVALAAPALDVLANLAASSIGAAREVVRGIENSFRSGVFYGLLSPSNSRPRPASESTGEHDEEKNEHSNNRRDARVACLRLCCILMELKDNLVLSYIVTAGSKERKIPPGLLFVALRRGMKFTNGESINEYTAVVSRLLFSVRLLLPEESTSTDNARKLSEKSTIKRALAELLSGDTLENITLLVARAPRDTASDRADSSHATRTSSSEMASSLLIPLLVDPTRSPFLARIQMVDDRLSGTYAQQIVRTLLLLLEQESIPTHNLILQSLCSTPALAGPFFARLGIPDPASVSGFLSRIALLRRVIRLGPGPSATIRSDDATDPQRMNRLLLTVFPMSLKKHTLSKAIQSANGLIVAETLKFTVLAIRRFQELISFLRNDSSRFSSETELQLWEDVSRRLPDLQTVLSILSKFDPFAREQHGDARCIVCSHVYHVLEAYADTMPRVLTALNFDWIRLLPENVASFCEARPSFQLRVLTTLDLVLNIDNSLRQSRLSTDSIKVLLWIMVRSRQSPVYALSRSILLRNLQSLVPVTRDSIETADCIGYEMSMWVDGLTSNIVSNFCELLNETNGEPLRYSITLAKAWQQCGQEGNPNISVSPLLATLLGRMHSQPREFALLACQVAAKCIVFHRDPLPLASIVCYGLGNCAIQNLNNAEEIDQVGMLPSFAMPLLHYSESILSPSWETSIDRAALLAEMIDTLASPWASRDEHFGIRAFSELANTTNEVAAFRQSLHSLALSDANSKYAALRSLLPLLVQNDVMSKTQSVVNTLFKHPSIRNKPLPMIELSYVYCVLLSSPLEASETLLDSLRFHVSSLLMELKESSTHDPMHTDRLQKILHLFLLNSMRSATPTISVTKELLLLSCRAVETQGASTGSVPLAVPLSFHFLEDNPSVSVDTMVKAWKFFTSKTITGPAATSNLVSLLENSLGTTLTTRTTLSQDSVTLSALLSRDPAEDIIASCFRRRTAQLDVISGEPSRLHSRARPDWRLLIALLESDSTRYGAALLFFVSRHSDGSNIQKLLQHGHLDKLISLVSANRALRSSSMFAGVLGTLVDRFTNTGNIDIACGTLDDHTTAIFNSVELLSTDEIARVAQSLSSVLFSMMKGKAMSDNLIKLAQRISNVSREGFDSRATLASAVLLCHVQRLYRLLKTVKESAPKASTVLTFKRMVDTTSEFIAEVNSIDKGMLIDGLGTISTTLRACLKYGIRHCLTCGASDMAALCLRVVQDMMSQAGRPSSAVFDLRLKTPLLDPGSIYEMTVAHSYFEVSARLPIRAEGERFAEQERARCELLGLLLRCIELAPERIIIDRRVFRILLSAFSGGVSSADEHVRRLLFACFDFTSQDSNVIKESGSPTFDAKLKSRRPSLSSVSDEGAFPFMNQFRLQSGIDSSALEDHSEDDWEWLISGIDVSRIRSTLCQFPVNARLIPERGAGPHLRSESTHFLDRESDQQNSDSDYSGNTDVDSEKGTENPNSTKLDVHANPDIDAWAGQGPDTRYSPAFMLPMILASLESYFAPDTNCDKSERKQQLDRAGFSRSGTSDWADFVRIAQRLCDGGALSFAFASLCSQCPAVRQTAVAVLRLFLLALKSDEARELASWRERPQLAMLVNSVQRGLTIRRAARWSRLAHGTSPSETFVPKISPLSAIFLARSALILSKPGDPMFGPINRYFLKDETNHGAFQETTRLPAFISLFCSSSDELGQARRERMWALQLLKDGFLDESCFHTVASCHAPELILTCFDGMVARRDDGNHDHERVLLLNTLTTLLRKGGQRAAIHLIARMGLLSWLRAQLSSSPTSTLLPSLESRTAFVRLVAMAAKRAVFAREDATSGTSRREAAALTDCALILYRDSHDSGLIVEDSAGKGFVGVLCDAIEALGVVIRDDMLDSMKDFQSDGLSYDNAAAFLSSLPTVLLPTTLPAMCLCPIRPVSTEESTTEYIRVVLNGIMNYDADEIVTSMVLDRVKLLVQHCTHSFPRSLDSVTEAVLRSRQRCFHSTETRAMWFDLLDILVEKGKGEDSEIQTIARDTLLAR